MILKQINGFRFFAKKKRMMSRNLFGLVSKYNEDGIFVQKNDNIYWFNCKRFEYWCKAPKNTNRILTVHKELYCYNVHSGLHYYQNKEFVQSNLNIRMISAVVNNCTYYLYKTRFRNTKNDKLKQKNLISAGHTMIVKEGCIFLFSAIKNEKYEIKHNEWSDFENNRQVTAAYIFNGIIYGFHENGCYQMYDSILDRWGPFLIEPNR